ncbi:caspase family protein [Falsiroseomonas stagni]|uniref:caspase family protein n=1 Tax=Falsiroseomonas stagni TaxID=484882 RepID=UPI001587AAF9|nr:caspase family protein [Falsiroseomonas stagni]
MLLFWAEAAAQDRRVALVIGNSAYTGEAVLPNAIRDAELVAEGLREIGFQVTLRRNLDNRALRAALQAFDRAAEGADVATIYFAGHGIAADGRNWLLPVDARLSSARHIEDEAVAHTRFASALEGARGLQILILDACRNNPFAPRLAAGGARNVAVRGLEPIAERELPPNRLIAFSARDGQVAQDGPPGGNGPYALALRRRLAEPGTEVGLLFRRVRDDVIQATRQAQEPWAYNSLGGNELFLAAARPPPASAPAPAGQQAALAVPRQPPVSADALDLAFWQSIQNSQNIADFDAYLTAFPQGRFAPLARNRIAAQRDRSLWESVQASRNTADIERYLSEFPAGAFATQARARLAELRAQPSPLPPAPVQPAALPVPAATTLRALTRDEIGQAQALLTALGFDTGGSDGIIGPRSRTAIAGFAQVSLRPDNAEFDTANLERLDQTRREFLRLTERGAISPRGTAAASASGAAARFERGWAAERANPPDPAEASYWYALAAREHEARALNQLGLLLVRGQGVAADPVGGSLLWRLAAARGDATAAFNLGAMLDRGIGLNRSPGWARFYYDLAAQAGHPQAREALRRVGQ